MTRRTRLAELVQREGTQSEKTLTRPLTALRRRYSVCKKVTIMLHVTTTSAIAAEGMSVEIRCIISFRNRENVVLIKTFLLRCFVLCGSPLRRVCGNINWPVLGLSLFVPQKPFKAAVLEIASQQYAKIRRWPRIDPVS